MASTKVWSHGDIRLIDMSEATDYGQAVAMTRLGVTGKTDIMLCERASRCTFCIVCDHQAACLVWDLPRQDAWVGK
jgi:hypothetical protein